jgi:hypothetical protein
MFNQRRNFMRCLSRFGVQDCPKGVLLHQLWQATASRRTPKLHFTT